MSLEQWVRNCYFWANVEQKRSENVRCPAVILCPDCLWELPLDEVAVKTAPDINSTWERWNNLGEATVHSHLPTVQRQHFPQNKPRLFTKQHRLRQRCNSLLAATIRVGDTASWKAYCIARNTYHSKLRQSKIIYYFEVLVHGHDKTPS